MLDAGFWMLDAGKRTKQLQGPTGIQYPATSNRKARGVVVDIHKMTLTKLPAFELYEEGSQIRRSIKSVKSNIAEGYGRRRYGHQSHEN